MCPKLLLVFFAIVLSSRSVFASLKVLGLNDDRTKLCKEKKCIPKCCEERKHLNSTSMLCIDSDKEYDFNTMPVYEAYDNSINGTLERLDKKLSDIWSYLVPGRMFEEIRRGQIFDDNDPFIAEENNFESYLTETAEVYLHTDKWILASYFCLEFVSSDDNEPKPQIVSVMIKDPENKPVITFYCLTISSVFMVLVLLVYIALPELRNLGGMILMAYVTSLLLAFILLAMMQRIHFPRQLCIYITASFYFAILSSFCWMNVMSVDIWWTFRGYAKARPIHRRGERFKFCMYCLYGWGLPGIMTIGLVAIIEADLPKTSQIIRPRIPDGGCFLEGTPKNLYLYIPMTILILSNWMFFLMTAYNIRRLMRGTGILSSNSTAAGNPAAHRKQKLRLMVYLKLSVIMGINWLFETLSVAQKHALWQISDIYNMFIGVAIFLIFVFKKKIYYKLKLRFCKLYTYLHKENSMQMTTKRRISESNSQSAQSRTSQL